MRRVALPTDSANPMKYRLSTTGNAHSGPFIALAHGVVVSHSKKESTGILESSVARSNELRVTDCVVQA